MKNKDVIMETMIKKVFLLLLALFVFWSCERIDNADPGVVCSDCYQEKPEWGRFNAEVTISNENPFVPLIIYRGNVEDNDVEYVDTSWTTSYWVEVPVNAYYSISAEYKSGGKTIFAIDGDKFKVKYTESGCDKPCYYFQGGFADVRLLP